MTEAADRDAQEVYAANARFYEAISALDLAAMDGIWMHGGEARCIHPGWDVLVGWRTIRDSWQNIFRSSPGLNVSPDGEEVTVFGDLGWVHCLERIRNSGDGEEQVSFARTTNLFVRAEGAWKMILHHASPVAAQVDDDEEEDLGPVH